MKLLSRVYPLPAAIDFVHVLLTWLYRPDRAEQTLGGFRTHFSDCRPYGNSLPYSAIASLSLINASHGEQYEIGFGWSVWA